MTDKIRWGLIGLGGISRKFATGLQAAPHAECYAVASRSGPRAAAFGAEFGAAKCYDSYAALADDPDVDVVYIGTPHTFHKPHTLLCLHHGKPALCEKPFAVNRSEAEEMVALARQKNLFLMDAMWTRCLPLMVKLRELLAEKAIGDVMLVQADFGFRMAQVLPEHRLFNPHLAGGALLDVGIYCLYLASMVYGRQPVEIVSQRTLGSTGVDELSASVFRYSDDEMAVITAAIRLNTPHEARIIGTKGIISMADWWHPREMTLRIDGRPAETFRPAVAGNGFNYEAMEVGRCLRAGLVESDIAPLDETLAVMDTMDRMRRQWGLRYPTEL